MRRHRALLPLAAAMALATTATAQATLPVGTSGWEWSNPQPQGDGLLDISSADTTRGYAVGVGGTLLTTADAGTTWTALHTGLRTAFTKVAALGGSSLMATGACRARRSDDGGTTLTRVRFTPSESDCRAAIAGFAFQNTSSGLVLLDDGTVLATSDGGATFSRRSTLPGTGSPGTAIDIAMASADIGIASSLDGSLARTTDGGSNWQVVFRTPARLSSITFADPTTAYAVATGGIYSPGGATGVFKSIDGGQTWAQAGGAGTANLDRIECVSTTTCIVTRTDGGGLYRTTDGGSSFVPVASAPGGVRAVAFFGPTRVVGIGDRGVTALSDDGGATWRSISRRLGQTMSGLRANADGFAYMWGTSGGIAITSDRGTTWRALGVPTSNALTGASFATADVGFAVDSDGILFRTSNGGASWQIVDTDADFRARDVFALSPTRLVLLGPGGKLLRSTDGGVTFRAAGTAAVRSLAVRGHSAGTAIVVSGPRGIALTTNAGATWRIVPGPRVGRTRLRLDLEQCTSATVCWVVATNRRLYRTVNAGRSWTDVTAGVGFRIQRLALADRRSGYVSVRATFPAGIGVPAVLRTSDGGLTWTPQLLDRQRVAIAPSAGIDYALDLAGDVFTTASGGQRGTRTTLTLTASTRTIRGRSTVTISGRLVPAVAGAQILISPSSVERRFVTTASNGRFSARFTIAGTTSFVAQWAGDRTHAGDGSPAVTVRRR